MKLRPSFSFNRRLRERWARVRLLRSDKKGTAAIEFAFIVSVLSLALLNVGDLVMYFVDQMEVNEAAQAGAQAAWNSCSLNSLPATINCTELTTHVTAAVQSTSLGTSVALASGSPTEAYYCVSNTGSLQNVGAVTATEPSNCTAAGESGYTPGDWIVVQTTYTWTPIFPGLSVASALSHTMTSTAWMRLE